MPSIPIPQPVPIERGGWSTDYSGNVQMPNSDRSPVNPIMSGLGQAGQQADIALRGAQTASTANDVQMKQRQMALSMINAAASDPDPEKAQAKLSSIVPIANKLNPSFQIDPNIDVGTARTLAMGGVPTAEQPSYALNQSNAAINMALLKSLGGATGATPPGAQAEAAPLGGNSPAATAQSSAPGMMSPQAEALLALARPEASKALQGTPLYKQQVAASETAGKNTAEAQKNAIEANEGYQQVKQNLESLKHLINDPNLPQSKFGVPAKQEAWLSQNFGGQKEANAYNTFQTLNESQTIGAIRQLADTGQIKMTRTLENIINRGYLVDPDASPEAKLQQANVIETELENSAASAQNVSNKMSGGQTEIPYKAPLIASDQAKAKLPQKPTQSTPIINTQAAFDALPSGAVYAESDGNKYRKP